MSSVELSTALAELNVVTADNLATQAATAGLATAAEVKSAVTGVSVVEQLPEKVALVGDSRFFLSHYVSGYNYLVKAYGPAHWLQRYSQGRIVCPKSLNFGVAGDTTTQILARLDAAIVEMQAEGAKLAFVLCGTNDLTSSVPDTMIRMNIKRIIRKLQQANIHVIAISESPRGGDTYGMGAANNQRLIDLHEWYEDTLPGLGVPVVNVWDEMVDSSTGYSAKDGVTQDGLHQNLVGAEIYGRNMWGKAQEFFQFDGLMIEDATVFNADSNPYGTLLTNSLFATSGGTIESSTSGTVLAESGSVVPANFTASGESVAGIATNWSMAADPDGYGNRLTVKISGTATAACTLTLSQVIDSADLVTGDVLRSVCMADTEGSGLAGVQLSHLVVASSWCTQCDGDILSGFNYPSQALTGLSLETPDLTMADDISSVTVRAQVQVAAGEVDATVTFYRLGSFKLNAPIVTEATDSTTSA